MWGGGRGAVMLDYKTKGPLLATFADLFIQYNKIFILHHACRNHQNTAFTLWEESYSKPQMKNVWILFTSNDLYTIDGYDGRCEKTRKKK